MTRSVRWLWRSEVTGSRLLPFRCAHSARVEAIGFGERVYERHRAESVRLLGEASQRRHERVTIARLKVAR